MSTDADGSKAIAKYTVTEAKPAVFRGTFEFTSGTGKYAGITGRGTFDLRFVGERAAVDALQADYRIPIAAPAANE